MFKIYPIEESDIITPDKLLYKNVQTITREECVIRVYIVKGIELQPKDSNGKVKFINKIRDYHFCFYKYFV
jgi:hypothetical protein